MSKFFVIIFAIPLLLTSCGDAEDTKEYQLGHDQGWNEGADWVCDEWKQSLPSDVYYEYLPRICS